MASRLNVLLTHLHAKSEHGDARPHAQPPHCSPTTSTTNTTSTPGILDGVVVVELATVIAAPSACALLADFGATVIKIEAPEGDMLRDEDRGMRKAGERKDTVGGMMFENSNRGKKSVQLNLHNPEAIDVLKRLLSTADVFVTNVREQGLRRLGIDYDAIATSFPHLIYAHLSAFGRAGPEKDNAGYDAGAFWAASGMMEFVRSSDEADAPRYPGGFGDHATGQSLLAGIAMALFHKQRTGKGQLVDACLFRSGVWCMGVPIMNAQQGFGKIQRRTRDKMNPFFNSYLCKDGQRLHLLGLQIPRHMPKIFAALNMREMCANDARFNNRGSVMKNRTALIAIMDGIFLTRTRDQWEPILIANDVWYSLVNTVETMASNTQAQAAGSFVTHQDLEHGFKILASPVHLNGSTSHAPITLAPTLGQHNREVLESVGVQPCDAINGSQHGVKPWPKK